MNGLEERVGLLAGCLDKISDSLVELTAVFRVKRQVLATADLEALSELLEREEKVAEGLFDAENRRELLAEEIASSVGIEGCRLVDIAGAVGDELGDRLLDAGSRTRTTMELLVREARIIATVCRAAMDHYDRLIRIISGAGIEPLVYTPNGRKGAPARRNIVDRAY
jgi:hypothetical protein